MAIQTSVAEFIAQRTISIVDEITAFAVSNWIGFMELMREENYEAEINLLFNSDGGEAIAGFELYRYLQAIELEGTPAMGRVTGRCYSAAAIVLLGCSYRESVAGGTFLLHHASPRIDTAMAIITATSVSYDFAKIVKQRTKLTEEEYALLAAQEKKFDAEAALRIGLIHRIC